VKKSSTQDRFADTGYEQQRASELPTRCSIPIHDGQDGAKRHYRLKDDEVVAARAKYASLTTSKRFAGRRRFFGPAVYWRPPLLSRNPDT